jgi:Tfp pilus assembly pilus retraction ATPase PilT
MIRRMYAMDDLLHLLHSDGADRLQLRVGAVPTIVLQGERHAVEGPELTMTDAEKLLQAVAGTRQRRELRERGTVQFVYRFRGCADFVVRAQVSDSGVSIDVH